MTLISSATTAILHEMVSFKFDNRETGDLAKAISQILYDFEESIMEREKFNKPLHNLRNTHNVI